MSRFIQFTLAVMLCASVASAKPDARSAKMLQDAIAQESQALNSSDLIKAASLYRTAAERGEVDAMYHLARLFENGKGYSHNIMRARNWYAQAVRLDHKPAKVALARLYLQSSLPEEHAIAVKLLKTTAAAKNPKALYELGKLYRVGNLVPRDMLHGRTLLLEAASLGDPDAAFILAKIAEAGQEMPRSLEQAITFYTIAAKAGNRPAQYNLGRLLVESPSAQADAFVNAYAWLNVAVAAGCPKSPTLREGLESEMNKADIQRAQRLSRDLQNAFTS